MEGRAELCWLDSALAQEVVVLEEIVDSDSLALDNHLDLFHQRCEFIGAVKVGEASVISRLCTGVGAVDNEDQDVTVFEEVVVADVVVLIAVDEGNELSLLLGQREAVGSKYLTEDLRRHLEMSVVVKVLEETLGIESVFADDFLELLNDLLDDGTLSLGWLSAPVVGQGARVIELDVDGLFKLFLGKNVID